MGLFAFFRNMIKKKKIEETGIERSLPQTLDGFDPNAVTPPDTRYTQEYQDFLAAQEAGGQNRELSDASGTDAVAESPAEKETPIVDTEEVPPCTACGEETELAETSDVGAEEVPSCTACWEETEPAETPEEDPRKCCEVLEETAEETASETEGTEAIPAEPVAPEADEIFGNEP